MVQKLIEQYLLLIQMMCNPEWNKDTPLNITESVCVCMFFVQVLNMPCRHKQIGESELIERELVEEWKLIFYIFVKQQVTERHWILIYNGKQEHSEKNV